MRRKINILKFRRKGQWGKELTTTSTTTKIPAGPG
jgi:hypothetical protein